MKELDNCEQSQIESNRSAHSRDASKNENEFEQYLKMNEKK